MASADLPDICGPTVFGDMQQTPESYKEIGNKAGYDSGITDMRSDIVNMKSDMMKYEQKVTGIEEWISFKEKEDRDSLEKIKISENSVLQMQREVHEMKEQLSQSQKSYGELKEYTLKLETQSRRDNLQFEGIPEKDGESDQDCRAEIIKVLEGMKITDANEIKMVRCHRLGPKRKSTDHPRPIILKLHWFGDRTRIWEARRELKTFRDGKVFLAENFPPEIERRRKYLYPIMKAAWKSEMKAHLAIDKLIVEGKPYTLESLDQLPESLQPWNLFTPTTNNITVFSVQSHHSQISTQLASGIQMVLATPPLSKCISTEKHCSTRTMLLPQRSLMPKLLLKLTKQVV